MFHLNLELVGEIEHSIALVGRETAIYAQRLHPEKPTHFGHEEIAGGIAVFTGVGSPLTQAIGVGLNGPVTEEEFAKLEAFFFERGAAVALELTPFIHPTLMELLKKRSYRLDEFSNVLLKELTSEDLLVPPKSGFEIHQAEAHEYGIFSQTVAHGFADEMPLTPELLEVVEAFAHVPGSASFLATVDGVPAGGGSVSNHGTVGGLFGSSTLPEFRRRGIQSALLWVRLAWLAARGCRFAHIVSHPGTTSQRNIERIGFRATYSRTKMVRDLPGT